MMQSSTKELAFININKGKKAQSRKKILDFTLFTLPAVILILVMAIIPFIMSVYYSFTDWRGVGNNFVFVGLKNFKELFTDDADFLKSFVVTLKFTVFNVIFVNIAALGLALVLNMKIKSKNVLRAVFFTPYIISLIIIGFMWKFIFTRGFEALYQLTNIDFFKLSWLGQKDLAFMVILLVSVWQAVGFYMMIYITGLQSVPSDILEAASLDGITGIRKLVNIILPLIMPSVTTCVFFSLANSLKIFDIIFSLTNGGPGNTTASMTLNIYKEAFLNNRFGYGTAKSVIFFIFILIITVVQVKFFKDKEVEA